VLSSPLHNRPPFARSLAHPPAGQSLRWSFGFNSALPGSVINLSDTERRAMFYVSANTGLIHDHATGRQQLLQGHVRSLSAL
jgi:hypothetical protein